VTTNKTQNCNSGSQVGSSQILILPQRLASGKKITEESLCFSSYVGLIAGFVRAANAGRRFRCTCRGRGLVLSLGPVVRVPHLVVIVLPCCSIISMGVRRPLRGVSIVVVVIAPRQSAVGSPRCPSFAASTNVGVCACCCRRRCRPPLPGMRTGRTVATRAQSAVSAIKAVN
jgi:hypothetical protein